MLQRPKSKRVRTAAVAATAAAALAWPAQASTSTWVPTLATDPFGYRSSLSSFESGAVFASVAQGSVFRSRDGGLTWLKTLQDPPTDAGYSTYLDMATPAVGFAANGDALSRTSDGGDSWERIRGAQVTKSRLETYEDVAAPAPDRVVVAKFGFEFDGKCPVPQNTTPLLRSVDGGRSWARTNLPFAGLVAAMDMRDAMRGVALVDVLQWGEPEISGNSCGRTALITQTAVVATVDGGKTWRRAMTCPTICLAAEWSNHSLVVATSPGEVFASRDDGRTWSRTGRVMDRVTNYEQVEAVAFASATTGYALVKNAGIYKTTDAGRSWDLDSPITSPVYGSYGDIAHVARGQMVAATSSSLSVRPALASGGRPAAASGATVDAPEAFSSLSLRLSTGPRGVSAAVYDGSEVVRRIR